MSQEYFFGHQYQCCPLSQTIYYENNHAHPPMTSLLCDAIKKESMEGPVIMNSSSQINVWNHPFSRVLFGSGTTGNFQHWTVTSKYNILVKKLLATEIGHDSLVFFIAKTTEACKEGAMKEETKGLLKALSLLNPVTSAVLFLHLLTFPVSLIPRSFNSWNYFSLLLLTNAE